ncbi:ABC transporter permease subunit [Paenibacillus sp. LMG 31456]|uniref:ABC transporter permease subunit n=1 Tax=Paenibacillus foliorum TaxID=2654974 RepID=A0A972GQA5_9BACL|nr:ABC transporter permease subunit [Paenibacillus foliorum]NOU94827.1 ABC transporter permease subunit [Paenibacillus foliorum]
MKAEEAVLNNHAVKERGRARTRSFWSDYVKYRYMYLLVIPGFLYFAVFKLVPMWGLLIAFKDYNPIVGFAESPWVGLKFFNEMFADEHFYIMLRNTLLINIFGLVFFFPLPILLAIMLNEVRHEAFKRINQSLVYMPHFLSWVVIASLTFFILSVDVGLLNKLIRLLGLEPYSFLNDVNLFWGLLTAQSIWKDAGWGTIIFLAAIAGVNTERYEAAVVDGANRFRQIWHVTLPAIRPTIVILLILRLGHMTDVNFEQVLLMMNPLVRDVGDVFDTYVYNNGILRGMYSVGVAVGFFKSLVGLALVMASNYVVKKMGHEGIY